MLIDKEKLEYLFDKAKEEKEGIKPVYNKVLEYTDPFFTIKDEGKQKIGTQRKIDSAVLDSIDALTSFIMSSILTRSGRWADIEIDEERLIEMEGEGEQSQVDEAKGFIEKDVNKTFKYIQASNYYNEIAKAVKTMVVTGTGCYNIKETSIKTKPFIYKYIGLDNLFILDDSLSRPNIIFKKHPEVNGEFIMDYFGGEAKLPSKCSEEEPKQVENLIECVIPVYDELTATTLYNYMVITENMEEVIVEKILEYNPFVVFRWDLIEGNSWGRSIVLQNIDLLEELEGYKELYKKQARRIANPAGIFFGNQELFGSLSLDEGIINFGGDPEAEGMQGQLNVLHPNAELMPLDKLISETRQMFRQSLMVDNLIMNAEQGKNSTATYINYMQEMFRKRFSNTYELINNELLEPTFMTPFTIMLKNEMLNLTTEVIPFVVLSYVNQLSKSTDMGDVNQLLSYTQVIAGLNQSEQFGVYLNIPKAVAYVTNKMDIPIELVPTEQELTSIQESKMAQAQQQQAMAQQQGVMNGQNQGSVQEPIA